MRGNRDIVMQKCCIIVFIVLSLLKEGLSLEGSVNVNNSLEGRVRVDLIAIAEHILSSQGDDGLRL